MVSVTLGHGHILYKPNRGEDNMASAISAPWCLPDIWQMAQGGRTCACGVWVFLFHLCLAVRSSDISGTLWTLWTSCSSRSSMKLRTTSVLIFESWAFRTLLGMRKARSKRFPNELLNKLMKQVGSVWPSHHGFQEETMRSYENPFQELKVSHECLGTSWVLSRIM